MQTSEKTYSFRAPGELGPRVRKAFEFWERHLDEPQADAELGVAEYLLAALGAVRATEHENQSALLRAVVEAFVASAEKVEADRRAVARYRSWAAADSEAAALREGALRAAEDRWRDE